MILYAVKVLDESPVLANHLSKEIGRVRYSLKLPKDASPFATFFWQRMRTNVSVA